MTDPSSCTQRKRTKESDTPSSPAQQDEPTAPFILLEIPPGTNTDLPVWHAVRSHQVDITWCVSPYSINVFITPKPSTVSTVSTVATVSTVTTASTPQAAEAKRLKLSNDDLSTTTQPPPIAIQPQPQQGEDPQNSSNIIAVRPSIPVASGCKPFFALVKTKSLSCPLPFSLAPAQPATPPPGNTGGGGVKKALFFLLTPAAQCRPSGSAPPGKPALTYQDFHTKQPCDIQICDEFLLNVCHKGESCAMHHTPNPFHWQLRLTDTNQWVDLNPRCQLSLERLYCDVNIEEVDIKDGLQQLSLYFDLMDVSFQMGSKYSRVRRLSNTKDPTKSPRFPTKWQIYWRDNGAWQEYTEDLSKLLLGKMADKEECSFHIGAREYTVDFTHMIQTNVNTGFKRSIRCRPTYRFPDSIQLFLDREPSETNFSVNPLEDFACWYPPVWSPVPHQDYRLVDVPTGTQAFLKVQNMFYQSISKVEVVSIQQIQNLLHWDKFQRQKAYMLKHYSNPAEPVERHLFHGTSINAVEYICHNNFDPRLTGVNGSAYGEGSYFSSEASYCNSYSTKSEDGVQHMFLAKVLVGKTSLGKRSYRRPPERAPDDIRRFGTCVDSVKKPSIFVAFDSCQCYPYYLIKYKELVIDITQ